MYGNLDFICTELHGVESPRILVESTNTWSYWVVHNGPGREALERIAKPLGLVITEEEREIDAISLRVSPGGHRLKAAEEGKRLDWDEVISDGNGGWPVEGATLDELARVLETRYRRPVVNLTSVGGRWSARLSHEVVHAIPPPGETTPLDALGLEMRWEKVNVVVTVVKDAPR